MTAVELDVTFAERLKVANGDIKFAWSLYQEVRPDALALPVGFHPEKLKVLVHTYLGAIDVQLLEQSLCLAMELAKGTPAQDRVSEAPCTGRAARRTMLPSSDTRARVVKLNISNLLVESQIVRDLGPTGAHSNRGPTHGE